jgi:hypothetical protein
MHSIVPYDRKFDKELQASAFFGREERHKKKQ